MLSNIYGFKVKTCIWKRCYLSVLNSVKWRWEDLLFSLSSKIIFWVTTLTKDIRFKVLIADDTFYNRTRSKAVELLSWVYDHVDGKSKKGFTKLTLGWSDGHTFLPIQFRLVSSINYKNIKTKSEYVKEKYPGFTRRIQAKKKKTELLFEMVQSVIDNSIHYNHLLFDSWFAFPKIITSVLTTIFLLYCKEKIKWIII